MGETHPYANIFRITRPPGGETHIQLFEKEEPTCSPPPSCTPPPPVAPPPYSKSRPRQTDQMKSSIFTAEKRSSHVVGAKHEDGKHAATTGDIALVQHKRSSQLAYKNSQSHIFDQPKASDQVKKRADAVPPGGKCHNIFG